MELYFSAVKRTDINPRHYPTTKEHFPTIVDLVIKRCLQISQQQVVMNWHHCIMNVFKFLVFKDLWAHIKLEDITEDLQFHQSIYCENLKSCNQPTLHFEKIGQLRKTIVWFLKSLTSIYNQFMLELYALFYTFELYVIFNASTINFSNSLYFQ